MQRPRFFPFSRLPRVAIAFLLFSCALLALGCPDGSGSDSPPPATASSTTGTPSGTGSTGGGGGPAPACGDGTIDAGEQCDDGNLLSGDGCSQTCQTETPPPPSGAVAVRNVQAVATAVEGPTIRMASYTAPTDGLLLVRIGAHGSVAQSVTFGGEEMMHVSSMDVSYWTTISVEMFYLPVSAGETGAIEVDYGALGTDAKAITATTLVGVNTLDGVQTLTDGEVAQDGRTGPNLAEYTYSTSRESVIVSVFTDHGSGIPTNVGTGHILDAHPTVPEIVFHETKVMAGHVIAPTGGNYTLGYQNTRAAGFMDYVMIVASFSQNN